MLQLNMKLNLKMELSFQSLTESSLLLETVCIVASLLFHVIYAILSQSEL